MSERLRGTIKLTIFVSVAFLASVGQLAVHAFGWGWFGAIAAATVLVSIGAMWLLMGSHQ